MDEINNLYYNAPDANYATALNWRRSAVNIGFC